jgi:hypothetical protein
MIDDGRCLFLPGIFVLNKAVPRRSENASPHVRQRRSWMRSWP